MAQILVLLTVLVCIGPSFQQLQSSKSSETVSLGGTATVTCIFSSGTISDSNYPWWAQQRQGNAPRALIHSTSTRLPGIPDRFSGSRSGNTMSLTIKGALPEDEAGYYCAVWTGSAYVFGGGTHMTVTGGPAVAPTVNLYPPSPEEIESKTTATFVCLIEGFSPSAFTVTWLGGGNTISKGVETTRATKVNDKYMASSYLSMTPAEWKSLPAVTCKVTHEGTNYEKSVNHAECP